MLWLPTGHRLGHGSTDDAKVNNPRNLVTPMVAPSTKTTPTATPISGATPTPPRRLSSGSVASTTSSFSTTQHLQKKDSGPGPDAKKLNLGLNSLSSSRTASHESLHSTASTGQQLKVNVAKDGMQFGNEVEEPTSGDSGKQRQNKTSTKQFGNEVEKPAGPDQGHLTQTKGAETSIVSGDSRVVNVSMSATETSGKQNLAGLGNPQEWQQDSQQSGELWSSIPIKDVGDVNSDSELNDFDNVPSPTENTTLHLTCAGVPLDTVNSEAQRRGNELSGPLGSSVLKLQQKESDEEEQAGDEPGLGADITPTLSSSLPGWQGTSIMH